MANRNPLARLDDSLHTLAALYQFRSPEERLYSGLTVVQAYCMRSLCFEGPQCMSELAEKLGVRLSTMTGIADQLEKKGLAQRVDHPTDRRSLRVEATSKGRELYKSSHKIFLTYLAPLIKDRSAAECEQIISFLHQTIEAIQGWRRRIHRRLKENGTKDS